MRVLYWDAFSGISGDMALSSLIALGADPQVLQQQLSSTGLSGFELVVENRQVEGIAATELTVKTSAEPTVHRHLKHVDAMIAKSSLSEKSQAAALKTFRILAEAESKVHGTTIDRVHFHEVGAVDSIVDIIGTVVALELLGVDEVLVSTLPWFTGFVNCAHGTLPLPAPATLELLAGFKFRDSDVNGELITPTGAALLRSFATQVQSPTMTLSRIGYGKGKNSYGIPNLLRAVLGEHRTK